MRYWQLQDKAHFPYARENVEYFQELINKGSENKVPQTTDDRSGDKNNSTTK